jgi:DNA polymerase-3 subunit chi
VRKACRPPTAGVVLMTDDASQLAELDAAMWTFSATDFLPHVPASDVLAAQTPILLTDSMRRNYHTANYWSICRAARRQR